MIQSGDAELCAESFGESANPPVLLIMGMAASMIWWEDGFCERLAAGGRYVIRYDQRDTGLSSTWPAGAPGYGSAALIDDVVAVLDAYAIATGHLVGESMGGALAQSVALDDPDRVASLTLITTSPAVSTGHELPGLDPEYGRWWAQAHVDWSDPESAVDYLVEHWRVLSGRARPFDAEHIRRLARADVLRSRHLPSAQNHLQLSRDERPRGSLGDIGAPTLVVHGTADPLFAPAHGRALAEEIPDARLLELDGAGHGLAPADWDVVVPAILQLTGAG